MRWHPADRPATLDEMIAAYELHRKTLAEKLHGLDDITWNHQAWMIVGEQEILLKDTVGGLCGLLSLTLSIIVDSSRLIFDQWAEKFQAFTGHRATILGTHSGCVFQRQRRFTMSTATEVVISNENGLAQEIVSGKHHWRADEPAPLRNRYGTVPV